MRAVVLFSGLAAPIKLVCTEATLERISGMIFVYFLVSESLGEQNGGWSLGKAECIGTCAYAGVDRMRLCSLLLWRMVLGVWCASAHAPKHSSVRGHVPAA